MNTPDHPYRSPSFFARPSEDKQWQAHNTEHTKTLTSGSLHVFSTGVVAGGRGASERSVSRLVSQHGVSPKISTSRKDNTCIFSSGSRGRPALASIVLWLLGLVASTRPFMTFPAVTCSVGALTAGVFALTPAERKAEALRLRAEHRSLRDIAKTLNVSVTQVRRDLDDGTPDVTPDGTGTVQGGTRRLGAHLSPRRGRFPVPRLNPRRLKSNPRCPGSRFASAWRQISRVFTTRFGRSWVRPPSSQKRFGLPARAAINGRS